MLGSRTRSSLIAACLCGWLSATSAATEPEPRVVPTFEADIQPILTRAGCNSGPCHGKARGQNGFALSLLAFDPNFDYDALVREARGRRLFPAAPEQSLLLSKATARIPHGGGRRLEPGGTFEKTILDWIRAGTPRTPASAPRVVGLEISPSERRLRFGETFPVRVQALYSDGSRRDVTELSAFQSSESTVVAVDPQGNVKAGPIPGEAGISARYEGFFATLDVVIPRPDDVPDSYYQSLPRGNFIDDLIWKKLAKLELTVSPPIDDAAFLRRAHVDVIGRLPTPDEVRAFLGDKNPNKRAALVDRLLQRPEYADFWANKWVDLLRPNPYRVGIKAVFNLDAWIRSAFRDNLPYDRFVREILTASGSTFEAGPATIWRDRREPEETTTIVSQLFLGIRLECAKCHHHPFEVWSQDDFYGFAAYFAKVGRKGTGLSPPISGSEEIVFAGRKGSVSHPLTGATMEPKPLFGKAPAPEGIADPRIALADWITSKENRYFTRVIVNRVWADLMGRGIVEPVDDLRATNPPTNAPLLDALADDFRDHGHDLPHLIRTILASRAYALSSLPDETNAADTRNHSRGYRRRLRAEVLLDAVADVTEVPDRFDAAPPGTRSSAIWTHRTPSLFLDTFGRPDPNQDPPCERTTDTSVVQVLHLMNAPVIQQKLASDVGRVARLAKSGASPDEIIEELYLACYSRYPEADERSVALEIFRDPRVDRRAAIEDLLWALLNSAEFVFKN
ncbi:MAG: DUF1549 and DUF1553 domain-containing protein [Isosphaeraceae bacterium]|nr:DUF1549 and DUF1553 domain-containing protein [Isosphaeraceae bacterium]